MHIYVLNRLQIFDQTVLFLFSFSTRENVWESWGHTVHDMKGCGHGPMCNEVCPLYVDVALILHFIYTCVYILADE
jgi:hypothetical protein